MPIVALFKGLHSPNQARSQLSSPYEVSIRVYRLKVAPGQVDSVPLVECQSVYKLRQPHVTQTHLWKCATGQCRSPSCPPPIMKCPSVYINSRWLQVSQKASAIWPRWFKPSLSPRGNEAAAAASFPLGLNGLGQQALQTGRPSRVGRCRPISGYRWASGCCLVSGCRPAGSGYRPISVLLRRQRKL